MHSWHKHWVKHLKNFGVFFSRVFALVPLLFSEVLPSLTPPQSWDTQFPKAKDAESATPLFQVKENAACCLACGNGAQMAPGRLQECTEVCTACSFSSWKQNQLKMCGLDSSSLPSITILHCGMRMNFFSVTENTFGFCRLN